MIQPEDTEEMTQLTNRFNQEVNSLTESESLERVLTSTDGGAGLVSTGDGVAFLAAWRRADCGPVPVAEGARGVNA